ncbi:MAG TPA: hypothetical protein VFH49_05860, partial [Aquabacterium sp.]|nr:hypothetical protein [Aquabacterium sp.]
MHKTPVPALLALAIGMMAATAQASIDTNSLTFSATSSPPDYNPYNPNGDPAMSIRVRLTDISYYSSQFTYRRPESLASLWRFIREIKYLSSTANLTGRWYIVQPGDVLNADARPPG